jgi:hypothetical protein
MRPDAAFNTAQLEAIQMHDPEDLVWRRYNDREQPRNVIFNPRTDAMLFIRGEVRPGYRSDVVGGKRPIFTESMRERGIKRPKHSADAARARRYAQ